MSNQTKSFIILVGIALLGTYLCLTLWSDLAISPFNPYSVVSYNVQKAQTKQQAVNGDPVPAIDTALWKTYTDAKLGLSFQYNPTWKIVPAKTKSGFTVLQVDPGSKYYNIKIYTSPKEFYIMDGLPTTSETIGGQAALNVSNALYGIKENNLYYTFDVGLSMSLVPEFNALVHSVKFLN